MKKFAKSILAFSLGLSLIAPSFASVDVNSNQNFVVATYTGNNVVLLSDIRHLLKGSKDGVYSDVQVKKAVDSYIISKLKADWTQKAKSSVRVTETEVEDILYEEAARNGMTLSAFTQALAYQGYSLGQLKAQIRNSLYQAKMNKYLAENVQSQIDRDAIQFEGYKNYQIDLAEGKLAKVKAYNVSYILVQVTPMLNASQARAKIQNIAKRIKNNEITFADAAKEYSDDIISAADGGNLGSTANLQNEQEKFVLENTASKLKVGQISAPVQIPGKGYALVSYNEPTTVDASLNDYIDAAYKKNIASRYNANTTLEQFLLNSVVIKYKFEQ